MLYGWPNPSSKRSDAFEVVTGCLHSDEATPHILTRYLETVPICESSKLRHLFGFNCAWKLGHTMCLFEKDLLLRKSGAQTCDVSSTDVTGALQASG